MKKVLLFLTLSSCLGFMSSCNGNSNSESEENAETESQGSGFESVTSGPGENKPCHVSSCSCKFGYAGNWDAKKCNKCNHSMSSHY